jgi:hypothetical protein
MDGINENEYFASLVNVYPNPATDVISLDIPRDVLLDNDQGTLRIVDMTGREVYNEKVQSAGIVRIGTSYFANGIYSILLETPQHGTLHKQFVVR